MSGATATVGGGRGTERARLVRRNTALLTAAQGLAQAAAPVLLIVGSIAIVDLTGRDVSLGVLNGAYFVAAATGAVLLGRMMDRLGRLPRRGDVVEDTGWRLTVRRTEGRRVGEVEITPLDGGAQ